MIRKNRKCIWTHVELLDWQTSTVNSSDFVWAPLEVSLLHLARNKLHTHESKTMQMLLCQIKYTKNTFFYELLCRSLRFESHWMFHRLPFDCILFVWFVDFTAFFVFFFFSKSSKRLAQKRILHASVFRFGRIFRRRRTKTTKRNEKKLEFNVSFGLAFISLVAYCNAFTCS